MAHLLVNTKQIAAILTGSTGEPTLTGISTFGLLGYMDPAEICVLTGILRNAGLIEKNAFGYISLTKSGRNALGAKSLMDFPPTIQAYMPLRFPKAEKKGDAWRP